MDTNDDNDIKIADYLDNKMTAAEEVVFMHELSENDLLRKQYEEELLMRALLNETNEQQAGDDLWLQPADEHIEMIAAAMQKENKTAVVPMFRRYAAVAAVLLVIGSIAVWIMMSRNTTTIPVADNKGNNALPKDSAAKDSLPLQQQTPPLVPITKVGKKEDSLATINITTAAGTNNDSLFATVYTPYQINEKHDPPELQSVANDLQNGKTSNVVAANEADFQLMGTDDRGETVKQYLHLYKGIAWLADNRSSNAITELNIVLAAADKNTPQYDAAQWYSALAWLKQKEMNKAAVMAREVANSNSVYSSKALQLLKALNTVGTK